MFRAIKELIETLRMELGKISIIDQSLSILTDAVDLEIPKVNLTVVNEKVDISVKEALYFPGDVDVVTATFNRNDVKIYDVGSFNVNSSHLRSLQIRSYREMSVLSVSSIEEKVCVRGVPVQYENSIKVSSPDAISLKIQSGKYISDIWKLTIKKAKFMKKGKVLSALEKILKNYKGRVETLRFVGYFKNVPLGRAEKIAVVGEDLVIFLKRKGKNLKADIVVVKSPEEIIIEVVR